MLKPKIFRCVFCTKELKENDPVSYYRDNDDVLHRACPSCLKKCIKQCKCCKRTFRTGEEFYGAKQNHCGICYSRFYNKDEFTNNIFISLVSSVLNITDFTKTYKYIFEFEPLNLQITVEKNNILIQLFEDKGSTAYLAVSNTFSNDKRSIYKACLSFVDLLLNYTKHTSKEDLSYINQTLFNGKIKGVEAHLKYELTYSK